MLKKDLCKILDLSLLEELNLDDTDLDVLMNHLTENIYELLNLYDYYSPSRLLLVPAAIDKAGDNILIFVSSNDRFSDIILENYASTLPSFSDIVLDYLDYVKYSKNLFPLIELFSFLPIIPLSHYTERDIMNLITETYRERSSSPVDVSLNITGLFRKMPTIEVRGIGYIPILIMTLPVGNMLESLNMGIRVSGSLTSRKLLEIIGPGELENYLSNILENKILSTIYSLLNREIDAVEPIVSILRELRRACKDYLITEHNIELGYEKTENSAGSYIHVSYSIENPTLGSSLHVGVGSVNTSPYIALTIAGKYYPSIVFYPSKLGKRGQKTATILSALAMTDLLDLAEKFLSFVNKVKNVELYHYAEELRRIIHPYKGQNFIIIRKHEPISQTLEREEEINQFSKLRRQMKNIIKNFKINENSLIDVERGKVRIVKLKI